MKSGTSIYAAGLGGSHSPHAGPEPRQAEMFAPLPSVKSTPSARPSSDITGQECLSTTTLKPSTTKGDAISSPQATRVPLSPLPGSRKARKMTVTSGRMCLKSLSAKDPLGAFLKTLLVTSRWGSTRCYLTWKTKATPQGRLLFQLAPSMPRTGETECGLLHTPTAQANQAAPSMRGRDRGSWWRTPDAHCGRGASSKERMKMKLEKGMPISINDQVAHPNLMWSTPVQDDVHHRKQKYSQGGTALSTQAGGSLNPEWVAWLMGYPTGWLSSVPWGTRFCHKSRQK